MPATPPAAVGAAGGRLSRNSPLLDGLLPPAEGAALPTPPPDSDANDASDGSEAKVRVDGGRRRRATATDVRAVSGRGSVPGAPPVAPTPALPLPLPVAAVEAADDDDAADAKELRGHVEGAPSGLPRDRADAEIPASSSSVLTLLPQSLRPPPTPSSSLSRRPWAGPRAEDAAMGPSTTDQRTTVMAPSVASSATSIPPEVSIHTHTGAPFRPPTHPAAAASATESSAMRVAVAPSPMEQQR